MAFWPLALLVFFIRQLIAILGANREILVDKFDFAEFDCSRTIDCTKKRLNKQPLYANYEKTTRQSATATQWTKDQKKLTPNKKRTAAAKINNAPNWMPQVVSVALIREFNQNFVLVSTQYFTFVISDCGFYTQHNVFKKKLCKVWPKRLAHESIIISLLFWWL